MELQMKSCTRCKTTKPLTLQFFPPHNKTRDGFDSWCRECRSSYRNSIRRGKFRNVIADEDLQYLLSTTADCVICGHVFQTDTEKMVDHDHQTGAIRGVLCNHCNRGLGHLRDDPHLLEFARIYLLSAHNDPEADSYLKDNPQKELLT